VVCEQHQKILDAILNKSHESLKKDYHGHIYEGVKDLNKIIDKYHQYFKI
jgi:DNA-binding FadR family transcriptional regulator